MTGNPRDEPIWAGLVTRLEGVEAHIKEPPPWRGAEPAGARPDGVALGPTLVGRQGRGIAPASFSPPARGGRRGPRCGARPSSRSSPDRPRLDRFGASPGPSLASAPPSSEPSAPSAIAWGPLAVFPPQDGADSARNEGTLRITDACVTLERLGEVTLLTWPADRTTWDEASRTITFENFDGTIVTVADGDDVVVGGSGGGTESEAEGGISSEEYVDRIDWVAPPASSCPLDSWWGVGAIELVGRTDQMRRRSRKSPKPPA